MKEIALQKRNGTLHPFTEGDAEKLAEFKDNQIIKSKLSGARKERSFQQLKMLHGCLKTVASNTEDENWNTLKKAKYSLKLALEYYDYDSIVVDKHGKVSVPVRSFSYDDLPHMEACNLFERAWPVLAKVIKVSVDQLLDESRWV